MNDYLAAIQNFYDLICKDFNVLKVRVHFDSTLPCKGLYIEIPFPKIYLNPLWFDDNTVYHELFHHIRPDLQDGPEFESKLSYFTRFLTKNYYAIKKQGTYC